MLKVEGIVVEQSGDLNETLNRLMAMAIRRRWWILITTCVLSIIVVKVSLMLPSRYHSEAVIFVTDPRVPNQYVVPNTTLNSMEAIEAMTQEILSRARLLQIINEFHLYPRQRNLGAEALTEMMRKNIEVQPLTKHSEQRSMNAFLIAFTANDPKVAQQVTEHLTSLFIQQNLQAQQQIDTGTTAFLAQQLQQAKATLDQQEAALNAYKMKNLGDLPEQQAGNLQVLAGLQSRLQTAEANLDRAEQQHAYLEAMLAQYASSSAHSGAVAEAPASALQNDIAHLQEQRDALLLRYSSLYPDVVNLNDRIAREEAQLKRLDAAPHSTSGSTKNLLAATAQTNDPAVMQLRSQLQTNALNLQDSQSQVKRLQAQVAAYQQRLTDAPVLEQQLQGMLQNYQLAKDNYANLLNKATQSELATKLAIQQQDRQFRVVDPANLPLKPSGPHRKRIALGGLVGALLAGFALAFLIDARDRSFRSEEDIQTYLHVPFVVSIPPLRTLQERHRQTLQKAMEYAVGCLLVLAILAAQAYVFHKG